MIKNCKNCNLEFTTRDKRKKFCGHTCAATFNNKERGFKARLICPACGNKFQNRKGQIYCSKQCSPKKIDSWLSGLWDGTVKTGLSYTIRKYLLEQSGYKCEQCSWSGINPISHKTTLTIEHIDGNCLNNKKDNLKVLCPNCHSLTPTYCALNKGRSKRFRYG